MCRDVYASFGPHQFYSKAVRMGCFRPSDSVQRQLLFPVLACSCSPWLASTSPVQWVPVNALTPATAQLARAFIWRHDSKGVTASPGSSNRLARELGRHGCSQHLEDSPGSHQEDRNCAEGRAEAHGDSFSGQGHRVLHNPHLEQLPKPGQKHCGALLAGDTAAAWSHGVRALASCKPRHSTGQEQKHLPLLPKSSRQVRHFNLESLFCTLTFSAPNFNWKILTIIFSMLC